MLADLPALLVADARACYGEAGRVYHDARHLDEMLAQVDAVARAVGWRAPVAVTLATLYHDAVYVVGRSDNEARSADLARAAVARCLPDAAVDVARVAQLIVLTAEHGKLNPDAVDSEAALFLDCDMSILGAPRPRFTEYERDVAAEYAALPSDIYRAGRRRFIERLLERQRIFLSEYFHTRLDGDARANLEWALASSSRDR
jgi:predicted metal-dependent HD superfamily phosphohydrolase